MYLIAGLGNPGPRYKHTRHNVGFMVVQSWAGSLGIRLSGRRFGSRYGKADFEDQDILLLCPQTLMNLSGFSVKACASFYRVSPESILIVHDDLDLPVGKVRVAKNGGAGGHKGVLSIFEHLGTSRFNRLKIGIGRPRYEEPVEEFVLKPFYADEKPIMGKIIELAVKACEIFVTRGVEAAMNRINSQKLGETEETTPCGKKP